MVEIIKMRAAFLKLGSKENCYDLFNNGTIFCNTLHYFAQLKDENFRGDFYEAVDFVKNIHNVSLYQFAPNGFSGHLSTGTLKVTRSINHNHPIGNLYCIYCLRFPFNPTEGLSKLNISCEIDDYCVYIHDVKEFCLRVEKAISDKNLEFRQGFVKYWDMENFEGLKNHFLKDNKYCHQNEYRYVIYNNSNKALKFSIGRMDDIACIEPFKDFRERKLLIIKQ